MDQRQARGTPRILLAGGTGDSRQVLAALRQAGYVVGVTVATEGARHALLGTGAEAVHVGRRDADAFAELLHHIGYQAVVDASHPFAAELHAALRQAAARVGIPYLRYERPPTTLPPHPHLFFATTPEEAARLAVAPGGTVFLTTGIRHLALFRAAADAARVRLVARALPTPESLEALMAAGFAPQDLVLLRGPFHPALNLALYEHFGARVLVTKESGEDGGVRQKVEPALAAGLVVVLWSRPGAEGPVFSSPTEVLSGLLHLVPPP